MRTPSRRMPPRIETPNWPTTAVGWLIGCATTAGFVAGSLAIVWAIPGILIVLGCMVLFVVGRSVLHPTVPTMPALAASREGESICTFARSFDCRTIDTWIIRAVFDEMEPWCRYRGGRLPVRAGDDLYAVFGIIDEDVDDLVVAAGTRAGRAMDLADCLDNPMRHKVATVADVVLFIHHQPARRSA